MRERTRVVTLESSFWKQASSLMLCIVGDQFDTARSNLTPWVYQSKSRVCLGLKAMK